MTSIYIGVTFILAFGAAAVFVARGGQVADSLEEPIKNIPDPKAFREERRERWGTEAAIEDRD